MKIFYSIVLLCCLLPAMGQAQRVLVPLDQSPMDISYFPENYPILKIQNKAPAQPVMRIIYSRPHKAGRLIFGGLVDYGQVWRLGANEATEVEFFRDVKVGNRLVKKGRYTMYAIPYADKWTLIINRDTDTWGAFKYNAVRDVVRVDVPAVKNELVEDFTIQIAKSNSGALVNIYWDETKASLPVNF